MLVYLGIRDAAGLNHSHGADVESVYFGITVLCINVSTEPSHLSFKMLLL